MSECECASSDRKKEKRESRVIESYLVDFLELDPKEAVEIFEEDDEEELVILEDQDDIFLHKLSKILELMMARKAIKRSAKRNTKYIA